MSAVDALSERGGFSRTLVHFGMLLAMLAFTSWWTSHTILDTSRTQRVTHAVLEDVNFRRYVASAMSPVVAEAVGLASLDTAVATTPGGAPAVPTPGSTPTTASDTDALEDRMVAVLNDVGVRSNLEGFIVDAHRRLIGEGSGPVELDKTTVDAVVRAAVPTMTPADVAKIPPVSIEVPSQRVLASGTTLLAGHLWLFVGGAVVLLAGAIALSGERHETVKTIGRWLLGISFGHLVVMWVIPVMIVPRLSDSPWAALIATTAKAFAGGVITGLVVLTVVGVVCLFADRFIASGAPSKMGVGGAGLSGPPAGVA